MARTTYDARRGPSSSEIIVAWAIFDQVCGIAGEVSALQKNHCLTQLQLAGKAGVPRAQISRIERGVVSLTTTTLVKVAEALN